MWRVSRSRPGQAGEQERWHVKCTVALEPLPSSGTSSVSRSVPNSRVATTICTGMNSPRRLADADRR